MGVTTTKTSGAVISVGCSGLMESWGQLRPKPREIHQSAGGVRRNVLRSGHRAWPAAVGYGHTQPGPRTGRCHATAEPMPQPASASPLPPTTAGRLRLQSPALEPRRAPPPPPPSRNLVDLSTMVPEASKGSV